MNFDAYVGVPFRDRGRAMDGANCWGLIVLFYARELGIELPAYDERAAALTDAERADLAAIVRAERDGGEWREVPAEHAEPGDLVVFRIAGELSHMGIVRSRDRFLHMRLDFESVIESLSSPLWARRIESFHRHAARC